MALYTLLILLIIIFWDTLNVFVDVFIFVFVFGVAVGHKVGGVGFCSIHRSGVSDLCWLWHLRLAALWRITW